ncbi:hypothetical protein D9M71_778340 [compost metagenome]
MKATCVAPEQVIFRVFPAEAGSVVVVVAASSLLLMTPKLKSPPVSEISQADGVMVPVTRRSTELAAMAALAANIRVSGSRASFFMWRAQVI